ncbi:MAG TPA: YtxH domain-containing protein [Gemmatimonadaceae bacterium]
MRDDYRDPPIIIEKHNDIGTLLVGLLIGAGVALLFAPKSGTETRRAIRRTAREAGDAVRTGVDEMTEKVGETLENARERVEEQIASARSAISAKKEQVSRAMDAGREAAQQARDDLERRLAETKAAYNAGADVARSARTRRRAPAVDDSPV